MPRRRTPIFGLASGRAGADSRTPPTRPYLYTSSQRPFPSVDPRNVPTSSRPSQALYVYDIRMHFLPWDLGKARSCTLSLRTHQEPTAPPPTTRQAARPRQQPCSPVAFNPVPPACCMYTTLIQPVATRVQESVNAEIVARDRTATPSPTPPLRPGCPRNPSDATRLVVTRRGW